MKVMNYAVTDYKAVRKKIEIRLLQLDITGGILGLAEITGFKYETLLMKVIGKRKFNLEDVAKISTALDMSVEELFFTSEPNDMLE
jgi:hypothetical protein